MSFRVCSHPDCSGVQALEFSDSVLWGSGTLGLRDSVLWGSVTLCFGVQGLWGSVTLCFGVQELYALGFSGSENLGFGDSDSG